MLEATTDHPVKCTRCKNKHLESERISKPYKRFGSLATVQTCPRCGGHNYYDLTPQFAWCWSSGLIEIGDEIPPDSEDGSGVIVIASGPKCALALHISAVARHGIGDSTGKLLVPGVPEAIDQVSAVDSLDKWVDWCAKSKSAKRDGIVFRPEIQTKEKNHA